MPRYIDATLLKAEFTGNFIDTSYSPEFIKAIIDGQPTADVQEVVRCKDCVHRDPEDKKCDSAFQANGGIFPVGDNDFCSYGERRKEDGTVH